MSTRQADVARVALRAELADELYRALVGRFTVPPLRTRGLGLDIDDAYAISLGLLARRLHGDERVIGKKIGVTSKAVQDMLGVHQPDFGFLTNTMWVADGDTVSITERMIQPRAEAEIALILARGLKGPGVTPADVLAATQAIAPCFEIVDSRISDWNIGIVDTVADNASCGVFVLGAARVDPRSLDLATLRVRVWKNDRPLSEGLGSAVQGSPLASVAWLANTLGSYGVTLDAGDVILSGSLVPLEPARPGDSFRLELEGAPTGGFPAGDSLAGRSVALANPRWPPLGVPSLTARSPLGRPRWGFPRWPPLGVPSLTARSPLGRRSVVGGASINFVA